MLSERAKNKKGGPGGDTFVVDVKFRQNATWQGTVKWNPGGGETNFRSTLELIKIMDAVLEEKHPEDNEEE